MDDRQNEGLENQESSSVGDKKIQETVYIKIPPSLKISVFLLLALYLLTVFISFKLLSTKKSTVDEKSITDVVSKKKGKIAVIPVYGLIYKKESSLSPRGSDYIVSLIKKYGEDKNVKGIVLDINSPGGTIGAVQEIYSMIVRVKENYKKPIVAHLGEVAASGGYYIAAACDKIISNSGTLTGSIGVIFSTYEGEDLLKKIGIKENTVKSGRFKDIGSFSRQMTKEEKKILEDMINDSYSVFVNVVAKGRRMEYNKVLEIADGRVFTGNQALSLGLVDKIGDLYDAIDEAGMLAGIGKNPPVVRARVQVINEIFDLLNSKFDFLNIFERNIVIPQYRMVF